MQFHDDDNIFSVDYGLEAYIKHPQFWRQHAVRTYARLKSPTVSRPEDITLPKVSIIHYLPETYASLGIDKSHSLMRNAGDRVYNYYVEDMVTRYGNVREIPTQLVQYKKQYQKRYREFIRVRNLERSMQNDKLHMVANYSLLQKKYKYMKNKMLIYNEYMNMRETLWETVGAMGDMRYQFIPVYLPKHLPKRTAFNRFIEDFPVKALEEFHETEALDLLDMWRIMSQAIEPVDEDKGGRIHPALKLSPTIQDRTYFAFIESGNVVFIKLLDLISWSKEKEVLAQKDLYKVWDKLIGLRFDSDFDADGEEGDIDASGKLKADDGDDEGVDYDVDADELEETLDEKEEDIVNRHEDDYVKLDDEDDVDEMEATSETVKALTIDKHAPIEDMGHSRIEQMVTERGELGLLSAAEQKGLMKLSEKYKELKSPLSDRPLVEDLVIPEEDVTIEKEPIMDKAINIQDDSYRYSRTLQLQRQYINKVYEKDVLNALMAPQAAGIIVKNVKRKEVKDAVTEKVEYSIQLQPVGGKRSTVHFTIPKVNEDGTFKTGNVQYYMVLQKGEAPIVKIKPYSVALSSYYGKAFIIRNQNAATNYERWIIKHLTKRGMDGDDNSVTALTQGISRFESAKLPRVYTAIAATIHSFNSGDYRFIFDYEKMGTHFSEKHITDARSHRLVPCGFVGNSLLGMDDDGNIHKVYGGKATLIGSIPSIIDPMMGEGPMEYAELGVFSKRIPLILVLSYLYGLDKILKAYKIKYRVVGVNQRIPVDGDHYRIKFKDESYVVDVSKPEHRLLIAGFNSVRKKLSRYRSNDFNKRAIYLSLLSGNGITQSHLKELVLMNDMFIDHITLGELKRMKEPTTFEGLLVRANELLIDDYVPPYEEYRLKGYERVAGLVYSEMVNAIRGYRIRASNPEAEVTMNPSAVWLGLLTDTSKAMVEDINPIHSLKEREAVTFGGTGGRSGITMTKEARGFKKNDMGVFGEGTPDSDKVGIRTFLAPDANVIDVRGNVKVSDPKEVDAVNTLSTSALTAVGSTHDDRKV